MQTLEVQQTVPQADSILLEQKRVIRAPRARVYDAWTKPEILKHWFGPANMFCPDATLDVREGGTYCISVRPTSDAPASPGSSESGQRQSSATGTFIKVVPNELLQMTWIPSWLPGEESLLTISFKDVAGGTEMTLRHENFLNEASREGHSKGWTGALDKLTKLLEIV